MPTPLQEKNETKPKRIAVLAVHGVADQKPGASVRAVGNLLLNLDAGATPAYTAFKESAIRIHSRPVVHGPERGEFKEWAKTGKLEDAHTAFLQGQVERYRGEDPDEPYETVRLEGARAASGCNPEVHLYEMYWADLSRLSTYGVRAFVELYQILLHLPSVGVHTLRAAALEKKDKRWAALVRTQAFAAWLIQAPIALTSLLLLAFSLAVAVGGALAKLSDPGHASVLAVAGVATLVGATCYFVLYGRHPLPNLALPGLITFLFGCGFVYAFYDKQIPINPYILSIVSLGTVTFASILVVRIAVGKYEKHRPGVRGWWWTLVIVVGVAVAASMFYRWPAAVNPGPFVSWLVLLRGIEIAFLVLTLFWFVFYVAALAGQILGTKLMQGSEISAKVHRARRTARLTLAISAFAFVLVSVLLWAGVVYAIAPSIPDYEGRQLMYERLWSWGGNTSLGARKMGWTFVEESALLLPVQGYFAIFAIVTLVCGLLPAVIAEASPPRGDRAGGAPSVRMGQWLSSGNAAALWAGRALYLAMLTAGVLSIWMSLGGAGTFRSSMSEQVQSVMIGLGATVAGGAFGLLALSRNIKSLAGLLAPLDALLDVDSYMREYPRETNPTARIFGRYISVLRSLCESGQYDGLVVVAHSQGTVITADVLSFLKAHPDPQLACLETPLPVFLFTMGSPIQNLYATFFPHLYETAFPDKVPAADWLQSKLGVEKWVNAYRSGDYIGRYLWRTDEDLFKSREVFVGDSDKPAGAWNLNTKFKGSAIDDDELKTREVCIGAGAHTHYWDDTAAEVALELDTLIRQAATAAASTGSTQVHSVGT